MQMEMDCSMKHFGLISSSCFRASSNPRDLAPSSKSLRYLPKQRSIWDFSFGGEVPRPRASWGGGGGSEGRLPQTFFEMNMQ